MSPIDSTSHITAADSQIVILSGNTLLSQEGQQGWQPLTENQVPSFADPPSDSIPLGPYRGKPCHLFVFNHEWNPGSGYTWETVRGLVLRGELEGEAFSLVSSVLQLQSWQRDHQFCGRCGIRTYRHDTDNAMICEACEIHYYPRLSPCIITVIAKGDHCLLAQHQQYKPGFYSALAGFVEPGETLEQTLHREVMEEVGLTVKNLRYYGSQPWPFPGQLMVGFHVDYDEGDIRVDGEEIIDAQWWHFRDLPATPPSTTLSGQLIQNFVDRCMAKED